MIPPITEFIYFPLNCLSTFFNTKMQKKLNRNSILILSLPSPSFPSTISPPFHLLWKKKSTIGSEGLKTSVVGLDRDAKIIKPDLH